MCVGGEGFEIPGFVSHYMPMILDNFTVRGRGLRYAC